MCVCLCVHSVYIVCVCVYRGDRGPSERSCHVDLIMNIRTESSTTVCVVGGGG